MLSTQLSAEEAGLESYEVSLTEPMHDLKNLITHILQELPHHIEQAPLKEEIKDFCERALSEYTIA